MFILKILLTLISKAQIYKKFNELARTGTTLLCT